MQYLKDKQYYIDRYDLFTIQECISMRQSAVENGKTNILKARVIEVMVYYYKGDRYKGRESSIFDWMQRDKEQQEKYDDTESPSRIFCNSCNDLMHCLSRTLYDMDKPMRMLFFFDCPSCKNRKAYFEDGKQYVPKPHLCDKCSGEIKSTRKRKGKVITTKYECIKCDFMDTEVLDFAKDDKEQKQKEQQEQKLLKKYRSEFCMSQEEGQKYISHMIAVEQLRKMDEERKTKAADPRYQKVRKLEKLTVVELQKLLSKKLADQKFIELKLSEPDIGRYVVVPFTVQDNIPTRKGRASEADLSKSMRTILEKTNWRLMSDGVSYRMGYLRGRLKGYEREDDLVRLL